jgi:N-acetylglutamate synthase-like GNAT family acetyltransferase
VIRRYRPEDHDAVVALVGDVLAEHAFALPGSRLERDLEHADFWVAELDGAVVGTVAVRPKEAKTCELKRLYVSRAARGRGVGTALYAHAEAFARAQGYERIWLDSSRRFAEARRLYEKNGFTLIEELDNEWCDNVYEKRLAP